MEKLIRERTIPKDKGGCRDKTKDEIDKIVKEIQKKIDFSGVVLVKRKRLSL